jgi:sec-independent protein translocase protein TatA
MPSLGPAEILVILVVALLVFGPTKMPEVARQAGRAFREFRRVQQHLRSEISGAMSDLGVTDAQAGTGSGPSSPGAPPGGDPVPTLPPKDPDVRQPDAQPPPPGASAHVEDPPSTPPPSVPDLGSGAEPADPA